MKSQKLLIIGLVWPEPASSAAGWRMLQLIRLFQDLNYEINFASAAQPSERSFDLESIAVKVNSIELNNSSFDTFIKGLSPDVVVFDRFICEEQFGWRVLEQVPNALRILDAEDFHGLRKARELAFKKGETLNLAFLQNEITKRELVSMYRCDLTLVISEAEIEIFSEYFQFPQSLMLYLPFVLNSSELDSLKGQPEFGKRSHFMTVGNYLHAPNANAIDYLKLDLWPKIRQHLTQAELHVYGAYQSQRAVQLHNEKDGFIIKGAVPEISKVMPNYRVCLAPLRFGAGLKGKIFDAMTYGTPVVMSSIAAEGLFGHLKANGFISDDPESFAIKSVRLFNEKELWQQKQEQGFKVLRNRFEASSFKEALKLRLDAIVRGLTTHRQNNFTGQLLQQQGVLATKYLSKWIEAKNQ